MHGRDHLPDGMDPVAFTAGDLMMFEAWGTTGASPNISGSGGNAALTLNTTPKYDSTGGLITYAVSNTMLQIDTSGGNSRWLCVVNSMIAPNTGPVVVKGMVTNMISDGVINNDTYATDSYEAPVGWTSTQFLQSSMSLVVRTSDLINFQGSSPARICIAAFNGTDVNWNWVGPGDGQNRITLIYLGLE